MKEYHFPIKMSPKELELIESSDKIILHIDTGIFIDDITTYPTWTIYRDLQATKKDVDDCIAMVENNKKG